MKTNSKKMAKKSTNTKVDVPLSWSPVAVDHDQGFIIPSQTRGDVPEGADITITVKSKLIKDLTSVPSGYLFRTHQYEFTLVPSKELLSWAESSSGYFANARLFESTDDASSNASDSPTSSENTIAWKECRCVGSSEIPAIQQSFQETYKREGSDSMSTIWSIVLSWPETSDYRFSTKTLYRFEIDVFRSNPSNRSTLKKVATKVSSSFRVLSKPEVYTKRLKTNAEKGEKTEKKKRKSDPKKKESKKKKKTKTDEEDEDADTQPQLPETTDLDTFHSYQQTSVAGSPVLGSSSMSYSNPQSPILLGESENPLITSFSDIGIDGDDNNIFFDSKNSTAPIASQESFTHLFSQTSNQDTSIKTTQDLFTIEDPFKSQ